jgi:hypothetical protein
MDALAAHHETGQPPRDQRGTARLYGRPARRATDGSGEHFSIGEGVNPSLLKQRTALQRGFEALFRTRTGDPFLTMKTEASPPGFLRA